MSLTQAERIMRVETRLEQLEQTVYSMDKKLDDLLALKNKGAGIFWLSSMLFGTSLAAFITHVASWFKP